MRNFPGLELLPAQTVDLGPQFFQRSFPAGVDLVDLFVVGNGFEHDVREHA